MFQYVAEQNQEFHNKIPDILNEPDDVKLDERNPSRKSLVFVKKFDRYGGKYHYHGFWI